MVHYEVIDKLGQHKLYTDITSLQAILSAADTNTLIARGIHVISIIKSESGNNHVDVDDWYFKPISDSWYPESEIKLAGLSNEYHQMLSSNTPNHTPGNIPSHVWVLRHYNSEKMQEINYKLHISKDIDINEYRKQFDAISIAKVINHQDLMTLLTDSHSNTPL